jgi:hypothetical protein
MTPALTLTAVVACTLAIAVPLAAFVVDTAFRLCGL